MAEIVRDGKVLDGSPPVDDIWLGDRRVCSYVPVLELDGTGYVGRPRHYAVADEVGDLRGDHLGDSARLRWRWPDGSTEVLIGYGYAKAPDDPTRAPEQARVTRSSNERSGTFTVPAKPTAVVYVHVGVLVRQNGLEYVTSGTALTVPRPPQRLRYEIRPGRRPVLVLRTDHPVALPALVLRAVPGRMPAHRGDGKEVLRIDPGELAGERVIELPRLSGLEYRLFPADDDPTSGLTLERVRA
jgi:hypothetical protein